MKVYLIAAISLDGFIAQNLEQPSTAWTSRADKRHFHQATKKIGTIVMGRKTFDTIGFPLSQRQNIIYTTQSRQSFIADYQLDDQQLQPDVLRVTQLTPKQLCQQLAEQGCRQLAVCGGSSIYTQFMQAQVVDKLLLTVEPVIFGQGIKLFNQKLFDMEQEPSLQLVSHKQLNSEGTLLLEYNVNY